MSAVELRQIATDLGFDAVGAASAEPYERAEQAIHERKQRGFFAGMRFAMARPEVSCHPETLVPGARSVVTAALCYQAPAPELRAGEGRLARYTWYDAYARLRSKLDALGHRLGGAFRAVVDSNDHLDREAAARSGVGFFGKNTMIITRRFGSWVVLGSLVTTAEVAATPPLERDCGSCRLCIDACPTGALDEPGVLDARKCLSYWTQAPSPIPPGFRESLGASVYGCDICQEACPWNRGIERRRSVERRSDDAEAVVSLAEWLTCDGAELVHRYRRLYIPRRDPRYLRRNALVALANVGTDEHERLAWPYADSEDELLREQALWTLERLRERAKQR